MFRSLYSIFGSLIIIGTVLDAKRIFWPSEDQSTKPGLGSQLLQSFSFYSNTKGLMNTTGRRADHLPCLDGIRFWSMVWVVSLHTYDFASTTIVLPASNMEYVRTEV